MAVKDCSLDDAGDLFISFEIILTNELNNVLNLLRICPTRIATGMSSASSVPSAVAHW